MKRVLALAFVALTCLTMTAVAAVADEAPMAPVAGEQAVVDVDAEAEAPAIDLEEILMPEPNYVCLSGWCSSDTQCVEWFGPGYRCFKQQGASCGQCFELQ